MKKYILALTLYVHYLWAANAQSLSRIEALADSTFRKTSFPGILIGVATPDTSYCLAMGLRDTLTQKPLNSINLMMGGSTGKVPVATVLLQLVDEGKLQFDQKISDFFGKESWFKRLPNHECLTIRNLMMHRSGLDRYIFTSFMEDVIKNKNRVWKPEELISYVLDHKPAFECDGGFQYSDTDYILLGMIIEKITGKSYYQNLNERIITPYALNTFTPTNTNRIKNMSNGYAAVDDEIHMNGAALDNMGFARYNWQFEWTGGGLAYNPKDYSRFMLMLVNGKLISQKTLNEMLKTKDAPELHAGYGLGIMKYDYLGARVYGHSGFFPGYYTQSHVWADKNIAVTWQINSTRITDIQQVYVQMGPILKYITNAKE